MPKRSSDRDRIQQVTDQILANMREHGWTNFSDPSDREPTPRDINDGWCEEWTNLAVRTIGGEAVWLDTFKTTAGWAHCVLKFNGKYYDSLHPYGCSTLRQFIREARIAWQLRTVG